MEEIHKDTTHVKKGSMLDSLPPKFAFWAGVVSATAVIALAGFILMIIIVVKGIDLSANAATKTNKNTNVAAANTNTGTTISGTVNPDSLRYTRGEGDLTIVEYSDLECPFCKKFHTTLQQALEKYDGKVRWSYKHFPLESLHPKAKREAYATECAAEQGKFWEYTDKIYERTPSNNRLEDAELYTVADELGLDRTKFDSCLSEEKFASKVAADAAEAVKLGGQGTPFSVIIDKNGKIVGSVPGAVDLESDTRISLSSILDPLLK